MLGPIDLLSAQVEAFPAFVLGAIAFTQKARNEGKSCKRSATKPDLALLESVSRPYWLVELRFFCEWRCYATDRGVIGLEDEGLFFAGHGCSFQIGPQDLARPPMDPKSFPWKMLMREPVHRVFLKHANSDLCFDIRVLERPHVQRDFEEYDLAKALWEFAFTEAIEIQRSYPPLEPSPKKKRVETRRAPITS